MAGSRLNIYERLIALHRRLFRAEPRAARSFTVRATSHYTFTPS